MVVFGEKNEEDASSHRNVSFTYSGGDVKLIFIDFYIACGGFWREE